MYSNTGIDKKEQLKAAVRNRDFSTKVEEESFNALLKTDTITETDISVPSETTLEYADFKGDIEVKENTSIVVKEKYSISARGKALIALYAFLLISIFAAIIFNATFLRGLDKNIQKAQTEKAAIETVYIIQNERYEEVKSPEYIVEQAIEMGMVK